MGSVYKLEDTVTVITIGGEDYELTNYTSVAVTDARTNKLLISPQRGSNGIPYCDNQTTALSIVITARELPGDFLRRLNQAFESKERITINTTDTVSGDQMRASQFILQSNPAQNLTSTLAEASFSDRSLAFIGSPHNFTWLNGDATG